MKRMRASAAGAQTAGEDGTEQQPDSLRPEVGGQAQAPKPVRLAGCEIVLLLSDFGGGNSITVSSTE